MILFFHEKEETVARIMDQIRKTISEAGYSISAGYAMREKNEEIEDTIRRSDGRMYEDKAEYYRTNEHNRRKDRREDRV